MTRNEQLVFVELDDVDVTVHLRCGKCGHAKDVRMNPMGSPDVLPEALSELDERWMQTPWTYDDKGDGIEPVILCHKCIRAWGA